MIKPVLTSLGINKNAQSITLKDATGAYDALANLGGYGTPNAPAPAGTTGVGFIWRYWSDDLPYSNFVSQSGIVIADLLSSSGHIFKYNDLGMVPQEFPSGVHHIKYYPLETINSVISLTQDSKVVNVTAGTTPDQFNQNYKAIVILNGAGAVVSKVLPIDWSQGVTSSAFYLLDSWTDVNKAGYKMLIATEADLKVLFTQLAEKCLVQQIGKTSTKRYCDRYEIEKLEDLVQWRFASEVKFTAADYQGAHELIQAVENECYNCSDTNCKTC